jgi:hypothetical protein
VPLLIISSTDAAMVSPNLMRELSYAVNASPDRSAMAFRLSSDAFTDSAFCAALRVVSSSLSFAFRARIGLSNAYKLALFHL